jgi:hypothetical protein
MDKPSAKPGPHDGSKPLTITLAGVIVGLALFIAFGTETRYGVIPFLLGGAAVGGLAALFRARRSRPH